MPSASAFLDEVEKPKQSATAFLSDEAEETPYSDTFREIPKEKTGDVNQDLNEASERRGKQIINEGTAKRVAEQESKPAVELGERQGPEDILMAPLTLPAELATKAAGGGMTDEERRAFAKAHPNLERVEAVGEAGMKLAPLLAAPEMGLTKGAGKLLAAAMGTQAATQVPEAARRLGAVEGDPKSTTGEKILAGTDLGLDVALPALGAAGEMASEKKPEIGETRSTSFPKAKVVETIARSAPILPKAAEAAAKEVVTQTQQPSAEEFLKEVPTVKESLPVAPVEPPVVAKNAPTETLVAPTETVPKSETPLPIGNENVDEPSSISIKNAWTDVESRAQGFPDASPAEKRSFEKVHQDALSAIQQDPHAPERLTKEIASNPRPVTDTEDAILLHRLVTLKNEVDGLHEQIGKAAEAGDAATVSDLKLKRAVASDSYQESFNAVRNAGTKNAQGLNARKMLVKDDFSLARMQAEERANANDGKPLSEEQQAQVEKDHNAIKKAQEDFEAATGTTEKKRSEHAADEAIKEASKEVKISPQVMSYAKLIVEALDARAAKARISLRDKLGRASAAVDPTIIIDVAEIGLSHLAHGIEDFTEWSNEFVKEFGEKVRPFLVDAWKQAQENFKKGNYSKDTKRAFKDLNPEEMKARLSEQARQKIKDGKTSEIASQVNRLARMFLKDGIKDRDDIVSAIHSAIGDESLSKEDVRDALSGYGQFRQLSKDEISVELRDIKGQLQNVAKLEALESGQLPKKTGFERREPSAEETRLTKLVNEAKKKYGVETTDKETQLKSSLDTLKKRMANREIELQDKMQRGDYAKKTRTETKLDREATQAKANLQRTIKEFKSRQIQYQMKQRSTPEKVMDMVYKIRRFEVLSGIKVLAKLAAYTPTKIGAIAATEGIGGVYSRIPGIRDIAARAASEGGGSVSQVARATAKGIIEGWRDAYDTLKKGESDLKSAYSERPAIPKDWTQWPQLLHEIEKSPLRRVAFELSFAKRLEKAVRDNPNIDTSDPLVRLLIGKDAYLDSDRALLLENNKFASGIRAMLKGWEAPEKGSKKPNLLGKAGATLVRSDMPVLTVSANFVKQTIGSAFGIPFGGAKALRALYKGVDTLTPQEADTIMRQLKYGTIGGALALYGFYDGYKHSNDEQNAVFGGYYQPGEKRKPGQAGIGGMKIGDQKITGLLLHNPLLAVGQLGHTIGAIAGKKFKNHKETIGVPTAVVAGIVGLLDEGPTGRLSESMNVLRDPRQAKAGLGEMMKGYASPQLVQEIAEWTDKAKRKPETLSEHVEMGFPGLRQNVPKKR